MNKEELNSLIEFTDQKDYIENTLGKEEWITVYQKEKQENNNYTDDLCFYSCLINEERKRRDRQDSSWLLLIDDTESNEELAPLVHIRTFRNRPSYIEISEKFRHYFDLYEDKNKNVFLSFDASGNSIEVIKVIDNDKKREVQIKKKYINKFLFVKKMQLCVQFEHLRWFKEPLEKSANKNFQSEDGNYIYSLNSRNGSNQFFSKFRGRRFIDCKNFKEQEKKYEEFSFINETGDEKSFTCEEDKLANNFGKNKNSPNHLTPISFRKDVLKKYYDKPNQYSVSDGYLECEGFWFMRIDIQDSRVMVFLGDLSKLPYEEQKYWRSYNLIEKIEISMARWERSFQCNSIETDQPDFLFKESYKEFNRKWKGKYGWSFFKPLSEKDKHCFDSLRIPLNEEQSEFDTQTQYLAKLFIDSIDVTKLKETFSANYEQKSKTIDILEQCLNSKNIRVSQMIEFLRKLQRLRSWGPAHIKKDQDYKQVLDYFKQLKGIEDPNKKTEIFSEILIICVWTIRFLTENFLKK